MAASLCPGSDQVLTPQKGDGSEAGGVICCSICGKMINSQSQIFMASKFSFDHQPGKVPCATNRHHFGSAGDA